MTYDLRNCDAMELLASLPDKSIDATITDPPYGTTEIAWDVAPDWAALMPELLRVTRGAVCVFSNMPTACDVVAAARRRFRYQWVWRKGRATGFLDCHRKPLKAHELILVFCDSGYGFYEPQMREGSEKVLRSVAPPGDHWSAGRGVPKPRVYDSHGRRYPVDVIEFKSGANGPNVKRGHPTQKPVDLLRCLVRTHSEPGGVLLDPFAGSASLGEACALEGRSFVGSELDPDYHAAAAASLAAAYDQTRLPIG